MKSHLHIAAAVLLTSAASVSAAAPTVEDYEKQVTVQQNGFSEAAVISTVKGPRLKGKVPGGKGKAWLQTIVNKRDGSTSYQLAINAEYWGSGWNFYDRVNFAGGTAANVQGATRQVIICQAQCKYTETLLVGIDADTLRSVAAGTGPWSFQVSGRSYPWVGLIAPAEAAAMLQAVERFQGAL